MKKAYILAGVSIVCWSTIATVSKLLLNEMNSLSVLTISALFAFLFLLVVNLVTGKWKRLKTYRWKDYVTMVLIGLPGTFFYYVFLYAGTERLPASQAFIINYLWPMMSVVFACLLLKERMTAKKGIALLLSFLGIVIVTVGGGAVQEGGQAGLGILFCVLDAISYGLFTALNQYRNYDKTLSMMVSFAASFVLAGIGTLIFQTPFTGEPIAWLGLVWNGIGVLGLASVTWAVALESGKTAQISNLAYITPFLSLIGTALFLKEEIRLSSVGGLVMLVCGIFLQLREKKPSAEATDGEHRREEVG